MSELRALYQEVILDHYKNPRNFRVIEDARRRIDGYNPLCGDKITLFLDVENDLIKDIAFQGDGCAISTASASLMTEALKGKSVHEAELLLDRFHRLLTDHESSHDSAPAGRVSAAYVEGDDVASLEGELGKLEVLSGVREYPVRIKCATLAWHALKAALADDPDNPGNKADGPISTE